MSRGLVAAVALAAALAPCPARAALPRDPGRAFSDAPLRDGLLAASMLGLAFVVDRAKLGRGGRSHCPEHDGLRPVPAAPCDPAGVPEIDRWVTRLHADGARPASDAGLAVLVAAPFAFAGLLAAVEPSARARLAGDLAVTAETLAATLLATHTLKLIAGRPRPLTYDASWSVEDRHDGDARVSFPSGHSSMAFASASVLTVLSLERLGPRPGVVAGCVAAYLAAGGVAALRVAAGKHFLTDVLTGASLGTLVGLALPLALRGREAEPVLALAATPASITLGGVF